MQRGCFTLAIAVFILTFVSFWLGHDFLIFASISGGILFYLLIGTVLSSKDSDKISLLPFFEKPIGDIDTFLAGKSLAWNSKRLSQVAIDLGLSPLCNFASGDPLFADEESRLFEPFDAIPTIIGLRQSEEVLAIGKALLHDLDGFYDALKKAETQRIRFSIHLRIGDSASSHEMETRGGSYF